MRESAGSLLRVLALGAAFSPVLVGLKQSAVEDPGHRSVLLAPLLIGSLLLHGSAPDGTPIRPRAGLALLAAGIVLELVGLALGISVVARLGLPLAFCGLALRSGRPNSRIALLAFGLVPIPDFVKLLSSPLAEIGFAEALARVGSLLGAEIEARGPILVSKGQSLALVPSDAGLVTAALLAEWGAYRAIRSGADLVGIGIGALRGALGALIVQPLLGGAAAGLLVLGFPDLARSFLYHGLVLGLAVLVLATHFVGPARSTVAAGDRALRQAP